MAASSGTACAPACVLAAGHGDGAVVEDLVGDVAAGGHRGPDGQRAGVEVGAVAQVLDEVVGADERLDADPLGALAAHLGGAGDRADPLRVHEQDHAVAADAAAHERPLRHLGAGVVGAARAEERGAAGQQVEQLAVGRGGRPGQRADGRGRQAGASMRRRETGGERPDQRVGVERAVGGRSSDPAVAVALADDRRGVGPAVEERPSGHTSTKGRFSSTTTISSRPRAKRSDDAGSSGETRPRRSRRTPLAPQVGLVEAELRERLDAPRSRCGPRPRCRARRRRRAGRR